MRLKKITCVIVAIMFFSGLFIQNECFALGKAKTKTQEQQFILLNLLTLVILKDVTRII